MSIVFLNLLIHKVAIQGADPFWMIHLPTNQNQYQVQIRKYWIFIENIHLEILLTKQEEFYFIFEKIIINYRINRRRSWESCKIEFIDLK